MTRANASLALWLRLALVAALVILLEIYARFFADPAFISPPSAILRAARSMGAGRFDTLRYVILPHAVPSLFTGMRLGMTLTLLGVILAELYVSTGGIGYYTRLFAENYDPAPLFALIGSLAAIAILFNELVRLAERRLTPGSRRVRKLAISVKT